MSCAEYMGYWRKRTYNEECRNTKNKVDDESMGVLKCNDCIRKTVVV